MIDPETCNLDTLTWVANVSSKGDTRVHCAEFNLAPWIDAYTEHHVRVPFYRIGKFEDKGKYYVRTFSGFGGDTACTYQFGVYFDENEAKRALLAAYIEACQQIIEEKMS